MSGKIKTLFAQTAAYGIFQIAGRFLTFLLTPLYTHYLTRADFGLVTEVFSWIAIVMLLISFGLESAFFRFFDRKDKEQGSRVFSNAFWFIFSSGLIIAIFLLLFAVPLAESITPNPAGPEIIKVCAVLCFADALVIIPFSMLRAREQVKKFTMTRFAFIVLAILLNILFVVLLGWGAKGVFYAQAISSVLTVFVFMKIFRDYLAFRIDTALLKEMLAFSMPTLPAIVSTLLLSVGDKPVLRQLAGPEELAVYSANYRLGIPMMLAVMAFEYAWKPFYLNNYKEEGAKTTFARILTYFTLGCGGIFLAVSFFMEFIVMMPLAGGNTLIPSAYWPGLAIIPLILGGYFFNGLFIVFGAGITITKKTKYFPLSVGTGVLVYMALLYILIPVYGYAGAAWATLAGYFISAVLVYNFSQKVFPMAFEWKRVVGIIAFTLAIFFADKYITKGMEGSAKASVHAAFLAAYGVFFYYGFSRSSGAALLKIWKDRAIKRR